MSALIVRVRKENLFLSEDNFVWGSAPSTHLWVEEFDNPAVFYDEDCAKHYVSDNADDENLAGAYVEVSFLNDEELKQCSTKIAAIMYVRKHTVLKGLKVAKEYVEATGLF